MPDGFLYLIASWMMLPRLWVLFWILLPLGKANWSVNYALVTLKSCMDFNLNLVLSFAQSTPRIMVGSDDRVHGAQHLTTTPCLWGPVSCRKPHGFWARLLLHLNETFFYRTRTTKSLIRLFTEHAEARFVISVNWAPPSLLLSLLLVILYAQNL